MGKSFGMLTQVLVYIIALPLVYCWKDNVPRIDVTCESNLMKVRFKFQSPFKGMVYTNDYPWNPACSFQVPLSTSVLQITLKIPYVTCGTHIDYVPNGRSVISNSIRIQRHKMVRTVDDIAYPVSCTILGLHQSYCKLNSKNLDDSEAELNINPSLEVNIGQEFLGFNLAKELDLFNEPILVFRAKNTGQYRDMDVKSCIIHENKVYGADSRVYHVAHPNECDNLATKIISTFTLFNVTEPDELVAFSKLQFFGQISRIQNIQITCGAQLCRRMCKRKCTNKASNEPFPAVATHRISKRSLGEEREQSSTQQSSNLRNKLLKATVSILNNRFFQRLREQPQKESFNKRSEDHSEISDQESSIPTDDFLKGRVSSKEQLQDFNGERNGAVASEVFHKPDQQRKSRMVSFEEAEISPFSMNAQSQNYLKNTKDSRKGTKKILSEKNRTLMKDLARKLASRSQKLKEHNEKFKDLIKTAKEENFPLDGFFLETSDTDKTIHTGDAPTTTEVYHDASDPARHKHAKIKRSKLDNFEVTTSIKEVSELDLDKIFTTEEELHLVTESSKDLFSTRTEQDELKQSTDAISIISVIEDLTHHPMLVQTIPQEHFPLSSMEPHLKQDNLTDVVSPGLLSTSSIEPKHSFKETLPEEHFPTSSMEPPVTIKDEFSKTYKKELSPVSSMEPQDTEDEFSSCENKTTEIVSTKKTNNEMLLKLKNSLNISQSTFIVVSIIMGLVIFLLIATVIGLTLHIRKEKKRHAIDNFLLYNFY